MEWKLWFIQLSGWPAFLIVVVVVSASMLALSVGMTWMSTNRSVAQNALLVVGAVAIIVGGLVGLLTVLTHHAF